MSCDGVIAAAEVVHGARQLSACLSVPGFEDRGGGPRLNKPRHLLVCWWIQRRGGAADEARSLCRPSRHPPLAEVRARIDIGKSDHLCGALDAEAGRCEGARLEETGWSKGRRDNPTDWRLGCPFPGCNHNHGPDTAIFSQKGEPKLCAYQRRRL